MEFERVVTQINGRVIFVHLQFSPNDALFAILANVDGIEFMEPKTRYSFAIVVGMAFEVEEVKKVVMEKITEFIRV